MRDHTLKAIAGVLDCDDSITTNERKAILDTCKPPARVSLPQQAAACMDLVTPKQAATILQVSIRSIWRYVDEGKFQSIRLGNRSTRFKLTDIARLIQDAAV